VNGLSKRNYDVITGLFARSAAGQNILDLFHDEAVWRVPGNWVVSGNYSKADLPAFFERVFAVMKRPPEFTLHHIISDGDCVAVDATSSGVFADGEPFSADYHFLFVLKDGLVIEAKEHVDSEKMARLLTPRLAVSARRCLSNEAALPQRSGLSKLG